MTGGNPAAAYGTTAATGHRQAGWRARDPMRTHSTVTRAPAGRAIACTNPPLGSLPRAAIPLSARDRVQQSPSRGQGSSARSFWRQASVSATWLNVKTCRPSMPAPG
ncbi:hypothetical protein GCM10027596_05320 [Nocardioides korecus]